MNNFWLELFGVAAVTLMVVTYALEKRHPVFVLLFACACSLAAIYAFLLKSYPFFVAETIWAFVAFRRWFRVGKSS